jgi:hypothetical protein
MQSVRFSGWQARRAAGPAPRVQNPRPTATSPSLTYSPIDLARAGGGAGGTQQKTRPFSRVQQGRRAMHVPLGSAHQIIASAWGMCLLLSRSTLQRANGRARAGSCRSDPAEQHSVRTCLEAAGQGEVEVNARVSAPPWFFFLDG